MPNSRSGLISSQFIEIIEWTDNTADTIVHKYPVHNNQIKDGAQLTVRESQVAIFLNEGQMGDVFYPGRHTLTTKNIPVFSDTLANERIPALDLSTRYLDLSRITLDNAQERFREAGMTLSGFTVENIALTEDVEKHVDKRSSMNVIGDIDRYAKFQAADSIPAAMEAPSGLAGMSAGLALGQEVAKALGGTLLSPAASPVTPDVPAHTPVAAPSASDTGAVICGSCKTNLPSGAVFCVNCGQRIAPAFCPKCGEGVISGAKFCLKCGERL
jgi:membrane protease subunit (stomatin/prohibitin family)